MYFDLGISDEQWIWFIVFGILDLSFYFFTSPFVGNSEFLNLWTPYVYLSVGVYGWLVAAALIHFPFAPTGFVDVTMIKQPISLLFPFFTTSFIILSLLEVLMVILFPQVIRYARLNWKMADIPIMRSLFNVTRNSAAISIACVALIVHCDASVHPRGPSTYNRHACEKLFDFSTTSHVKLPVPASYQGALLIWYTGVVLAITNFILERVSGFGFISFHWLRNPTEGDNEQRDGAQTKQEKLPDEHHLPMVPWYSMFLFNTAFELLVSLKLFLGRFDHRSLQRAIHANDDDYIFDHLASRDEVWLDFVADCGDGFDSSYQVARFLAQPVLEVESSSNCRKDGKQEKQPNETRMLPRGDVLIVGGDLAYPHPNASNYESRCWRVFEYAMKPPSFYDPTAVSARKLGLAPYHGKKNDALAVSTTPSLEKYEGPCAFAIPGNHDWFDGLSTFNRFICNRDWLGGWHLPQKTSHFVLKLPKGWWLIAVDLALEDDINTEQFELFQRVAEKFIQPEDAVIIVTHEPRWILDGVEGREKSEEKLTYLINRVFNGRVVIRLAGDIHNYMRHSLVTGVSAENTTTETKVSGTTRSRAESRKSSHNMARDHFPHMYDTTRPSTQKTHRNEKTGERSHCGAIKHFIVSGGGGAFLHPTHAPNCDTIRVNDATYGLAKCYPPKHVSRRYALLNVFGFRRINWRFDVIGGLGYFCLIASMFPRCSVRDIYKSPSWLAMLQLFILEVCAVQYEMVSSSYVSLTTFLYMLVTLIFFADCTTFTKQILCGMFMSWIHCVAASACLIFYECIVDFAILKGGLGQEGSHSLFQYFTTNVFSFSNLTSIQSTQSTLDYIVELYFSFMRFCMSAFDIPEVVAIHRNKICTSGGFEDLTRFEMWTYYLSVFPYFFVLAAPVVGFVFGLYLYLSLNLWGVHYNEAFSALRISSYKNFLRLHIQSNGDLLVHAIGIDKMPRKWCRDTAWSGANNHPENHKPSYQWSCPSYWKPVSTRVSNMLRIDFENRRFDGKFNISDRSNAHLIEKILIKKPSHIF